MSWKDLDAAQKRKIFSQKRTCDMDNGSISKDTSLEELLRLKRKQNEAVNREIKEHYDNRIENKLGKTLWNKAHRQVSLVLSLVRRDIVECDLETVLNEQDPFVFESVKNVIEEYKGLFEEAFLLLNISKTGKYVYNIEKAARDGQLENYYSLYLNGKETDKYPAMNAEIKTCCEIESNTRHFMKYIATRAKLATIVVNGHGTPSGEILLEDDSKYLSSKFLKDVHKIWEELHKEEVVDKDNVILPAKVTVVFAQCYGHRYEQDPEHEHAIRVVSLSTDKTPETTYTIKRCGHDFIDSKHEELNEYAIRNKTGTSPEQNPDSLPKSLGAETMQATVDDRLGCEFFVPSLFATISLARSYSINFNELLKQIVNGWRKGKRKHIKTHPVTVFGIG